MDQVMDMLDWNRMSSFWKLIGRRLDLISQSWWIVICLLMSWVFFLSYSFSCSLLSFFLALFVHIQCSERSLLRASLPHPRRPIRRAPILVRIFPSNSANFQPYTIELVKAVEDAGVKIFWWEECLHPDDFDGHIKLNQALPHIKFTTGEHEYSKWAFSLFFFAVSFPVKIWLSLSYPVHANSTRSQYWF